MRPLQAFFLPAHLAQAAQLTGTVTNKTTGKPAAGDTVVLVEPMTGMTEVAHTTVDDSGHYTITRPSNAPALVKVTHQGAEFFADAPQSGAVPDIAVYDVAPKVDGVFIEADVLEIESRQRPVARNRALLRAQHEHAAAYAVEPEEL